MAGGLHRVAAPARSRKKIGFGLTTLDSDLFSQRERAALEYAEAMTYTNRDVDDALMARLKQHFDDDAIVELTGLVAFQNLSSKFNSALDVAPQGFCRLQPREQHARPSTRRVPVEQSR